MNELTNFHLIGCGGVGTKFLRDLALSKQFKIKNMSLWDADIVEEKNLIRQLFDLDDIGSSKSDVLHDRMLQQPYADVLEEQGSIQSVGDFNMSSASSMGLNNQDWAKNTIIFLATDNLESRVLALKLIDEWGGISSMLVSAANADASEGLGLGCTAWVYKKSFNNTDKDPRKRHNLTCKENQINTGRPCSEDDSSQTNIANSGASQRALELLTIWTHPLTQKNKNNMQDSMPVEHSLFWRQDAK